MTASRIREAALVRFAKQGFCETSMNEIAADVGIKKPSLYAHFRNKEELFIELIQLMIESEFNQAKAIFNNGEAAKQQLYAYLHSLDQRFESSDQVRFWVRVLYAPPVHLYEDVSRPMKIFMKDLEELVRQTMQRAITSEKSRFSAETLTQNYMAIIDSLHCELIYHGVIKYRALLAEIWSVFEVVLELQRPD